MDTTILLIATISAYCWWFKIQLDKTKELAQEHARVEKEKTNREERVKQLTNKW